MKIEICKEQSCNNKVFGKRTQFCSDKCSIIFYRKHHKRNYTLVYVLGKASYVFTNGLTEKIKKSGFVEKERQRILNDCIQNPKKYLK